MSRKRFVGLSVTVLALASGCVSAQSLGDLARQQQQKRQSQNGKSTTTSPKKLITNEDMPESKAPQASAPEHKSDDAAASSSAAGTTAEQWKGAIQAQKSLVAQLEQSIEKEKASIHYVEANLYTNGAQYNEKQQQKQAEVDHREKQLTAEKAKLANMQEACRKAGFGNAVYE